MAFVLRACGGGGCLKEETKMFFFEKKNQKTFNSCAS
jgi:hypothetical protein